MSQLIGGAARQLTFDDAAGPGWGGATQAIDDIRDRFGDAAIGPATLVGLRPKRRGDAPWGPDPE